MGSAKMQHRPQIHAVPQLVVGTVSVLPRLRQAIPLVFVILAFALQHVAKMRARTLAGNSNRTGVPVVRPVEAGEDNSAA